MKKNTWLAIIAIFCIIGSSIQLGSSASTPPFDPEPKKLGFILYSTDAIEFSAVIRYSMILANEGYQVQYRADLSDIPGFFAALNALEGPDDTVFVYIGGHGNYLNGDSYVKLKPGGSYLYSSVFRTYMDLLQAENKGFLIEACFSGGFTEDFANHPNILAMTSANKYREACAVDELPSEGKFSMYFWNRIDAGDNAIEAFNYAKIYTGPQLPQIIHTTSYDFFAPVPSPPESIPPPPPVET
ncbi:MAG: C13 family peptidase [Candidatus Odinarchaeota archaeon]